MPIDFLSWIPAVVTTKPFHAYLQEYGSKIIKKKEENIYGV